ncbi:pentatricopeptide repeat-containing protein At1g62680, mitochondrial [Selaginella moellendorffii]|uniref:pentatricopeptide repeat-containing protein At1g62680, mitochondrial n=1 Tax=Selaginella moellendorffii TaxID=88036 RepID=UPI000D1D0EF8|nr:pentatricopeptide repeat-containing protein At1g62680, mitochondrial [Selaginella moellendorffii]|eukprot:XP_024528672.1 pentatricopeptide repeat-containing protein At1g62680, mitochondrial [Selaginella moellendorffii]
MLPRRGAALARISSKKLFQNRGNLRSIASDGGGMQAIDELDANVAADHERAARDYQSGSLEESIDSEYAESSRASYRQSESDVRLLVSEILRSNDVACVKAILQRWLRQMSVDPLRSAAAVSYDEVVSVASDLVREFGTRGSVQITMAVLDWMQLQNWFHLDPYLRIHIIDVLGKASSFDIAVQVFNHFIKISVKKDAGMYNALLHAFCKAGKLEAVDDLFRDMKQSIRPNHLSYNILMHSYVKAGHELTKVVSVFKEMYLRGVKASVASYNILIAACATGKQAWEARVFFSNMKKQDLEPNVITYSSLINVYVASGNCAAALDVLREMVKAEVMPNVTTFSCLLHGYGQEGRIEEAMKIFQTMKDLGIEPSAITFNILMTMYSKSGHHALAQSCFHEMIESGLEPTYVSFLSLMYCFKSVGAYKEVLGIYDDVKRNSSLCNIYIFTEALDACVKWGNWSKLEGIFSDMKAARCDPNVVTCTVVLMALSSKNCKTVEEATILINFFREFDSKPIIILRYLLMETLDDDQVEALVLELGKVISPDNVKTWKIFTSGLIDALWTLGWHRRAAIILKWTLQRGYRECQCLLNRREWRLDLRNLSVGAAQVAFYQFLKWLEEAARATVRDDAPEPGFDKRSEASSLAALEISLEALVPAGPIERVFPDFVNFPAFVTVVTGWGKFSKVEGESVVREAVEREIVKLGIPFTRLAGSWRIEGRSLRMWLLTADMSKKLLVSDSAGS